MNSIYFYFTALNIIFNLCPTHSTKYCYEANGGQCPQQKYSNSQKNISCECFDDKNITCDGTRGLDLIFAIFYNQLHHTLRYFEALAINRCTSDQLKSNLFDGIKFKTIKVFDCHNVKDFSPHIFGPTSDYVEYLDLELFKDQKDTEFHSFWTNVFRSIGHLSQLKGLKIAKFNAMVIPDLALKSLSSQTLRITDIHFNNGKDEKNVIESIGKEAFNDLVDLTTLDFSNTEIGSIKEYAFQSQHSNAKQMNLSLTAEHILRTNFDTNSLKAFNRVITLVINSPQNNITFHLNQTYLRPFLEENKENLISITKPIECKQQFLDQNSWLLNHKKQVFVKCNDGIDLIEKLSIVY